MNNFSGSKSQTIQLARRVRTGETSLLLNLPSEIRNIACGLYIIPVLVKINNHSFLLMVVALVAFFLLARIWGEDSVIHLPPAFFFFF